MVRLVSHVLHQSGPGQGRGDERGALGPGFRSGSASPCSLQSPCKSPRGRTSQALSPVPTLPPPLEGLDHGSWTQKGQRRTGDVRGGRA